MPFDPDAPVLAAATPAEWRAWLESHGATAAEVWLLIPKKGSPYPGPDQRQAIEEALCYGWIDGLNRAHDEHRRAQRFTPRGPRSTWSVINRELVAELEAHGRMTDAGRAVIEQAKADGRWDLLVGAQTGVVPDDLRAALDADPTAARGWDVLAPSARRMVLEGLARAVRPETRARRVAAAVEEATAAHLRPRR